MSWTFTEFRDVIERGGPRAVALARRYGVHGFYMGIGFGAAGGLLAGLGVGWVLFG